MPSLTVDPRSTPSVRKVCIGRGWLYLSHAGLWPVIRAYLFMVGVELLLLDLYLFRAFGAGGGAALRYPAPGGTDTLRASLFTAVTALVAAAVSAPRMRRLFLLEWTAVPLSSIPFEVLTRDGTLPEELVNNFGEMKLGIGATSDEGSTSSSGACYLLASPRISSHLLACTLTSSLPVLPPSSDGEMPPAPGLIGAIAGLREGATRAPATPTTPRRSSRVSASSMCSDESNSEIAGEIMHMTRGLAAQRNAGVHCIGRHAGGSNPRTSPYALLLARCGRCCSLLAAVAAAPCLPHSPPLPAVTRSDQPTA